MPLSLERWLGKVAVVTGANSGIGAAISEKLVKEGINVVGVDKNIGNIKANSKALAKEKGKLYAFKADITVEEDILKVFKWTKENIAPVSILVNNAGTTVFCPILEGKTEDWRTVLNVNLLGYCIAAREAIQTMREHNIDGHIVNICSVIGHKIIPGPHNMYGPSKFAVRAVTETIRLELNALKSKIKIGCVSPGVVETAMTKEYLDASEEKIALNPTDIADAVIYSLSTPPHVQIQELIVKPVGEPF